MEKEEDESGYGIRKEHIIDTTFPKFTTIELIQKVKDYFRRNELDSIICAEDDPLRPLLHIAENQFQFNKLLDEEETLFYNSYTIEKWNKLKLEPYENDKQSNFDELLTSPYDFNQFYNLSSDKFEYINYEYGFLTISTDDLKDNSLWIVQVDNSVHQMYSLRNSNVIPLPPLERNTKKIIYCYVIEDFYSQDTFDKLDFKYNVLTYRISRIFTRKPKCHHENGSYF